LPSDLDPHLREQVARRAAFRCEYCLLHEDDSFSPHQVDHIISRKHGGLSVLDNLAYACIRCNAWKGTDLGSLQASTGELVPFFHPRRHCWSEHFRLAGTLIKPLTPEGEVTARILRLNLDKRMVERRLLLALGRYP
jgi:HNH endonuclease